MEADKAAEAERVKLEAENETMRENERREKLKEGLEKKIEGSEAECL